MQCNKLKLKRENSESGFVLIVALMGIMILLAVGFFALTVSTKDLMIASRLLGERKAFSAAEAGVHAISSSYTGTGADDTGTSSDCSSIIISCNNAHWRLVDPNEPNACYCVSGSAAMPGAETCSGAFSIEGGISWSCKNYASTVTGRYRPSIFNVSKAMISIGVKGKASPNTPGYDFN